MRKFPFPRIHGPDHDLCIRSISAVICHVHVKITDLIDWISLLWVSKVKPDYTKFASGDYTCHINLSQIIIQYMAKQRC